MKQAGLASMLFLLAPGLVETRNYPYHEFVFSISARCFLNHDPSAFFFPLVVEI